MSASMQAPIPDRAASRYAGQYENSSDVERLFQVLRDSIQIALESKVEETAKGRFDLALECYHQLGEVGLPAEISGKIQGFVEDLVERFPTAWRVHAAIGLMERAEAARRAETRDARLREARELLAAGLASGETVKRHELEALVTEIDRHLGGPGGGSMGNPAGQDPMEEDADQATPSSSTALVIPSASPVDGTAFEAAAVDLGDVPGPDAASQGERKSGPERASIVLGILPRVHLAMLQERRAGVHTLRIANQSDVALADLELRVTSEPPFVRPSKLRIEALEPGAELDLGPRRIAGFLTHDRGILARLSERAEGTVTVALHTQDGRELAQVMEEWTLFPTDTWFGLGTLPELLAAYVLPNDPAVEATLSLVAQSLSAATNSPTIDGYQSKDPVRALRIVEATYVALQAAELTYANPPASFESDGQRVRFPSAIISSRLGTCLDLALFAASVLEQAGLHPLLIVTEGHAFVGAWLVEDTFANPVVEEPTRLAKRIELSEIVAFDATCVSVRPSPDFEGARLAAQERLADPTEFRLAIDVRRARLGGVLPLPILEVGAYGATGTVPQENAAPTKSARDLDEELRVYLEAERRRRVEDETPDTRLDRWLRQLLDLTMRNRLLNSASSTKRIIPLIPGDLGAIEDRLADGKVFRVLDRPVELEGAKPGGPEAERIAPLLSAGVKAGELRSWLPAGELEERLLNLYREARTAREEGGAGALYLAVGFLVYRETQQSTRTRRAPLLLLPLELKRKSARRGYTLVQGADEPRANVTLLEYLRRDHQIDVTGLDPLPLDGQGVDVPLVLQIFKNAIKEEDGWEIVDEAEIGLYSFAKYLLWRDLKDRADVLRRNELVAHLIERPSEAFPDRVEVPDPDTLDETFSASEVFAPLSYDSSQLSAILAAASGKTMVLEGPPGTGKSQTITNLVAHAIAQDKTILFVSEKMAALDVVHRRLRHLGLGPACLELHSNKANKKAVLEQFREALEEGRVRGARRRPWAEIAQDLDSARKRLNQHVGALHDTRASGESVHQVIGQTASAAAPLSGAWSLADDLGIEDPKAVDESTLHKWRSLLDEIDIVSGEQLVGPEHPLLLVGQTEYSPIFETESLGAVRAFDAPASEFVAAGSAALAAIQVPDSVSSAMTSEAAWRSLASVLSESAAEHPGAKRAEEWLSSATPREDAAAAIGLVEEYQQIVSDLGATFRVSPTTLALPDLEALRREYVAGGFFKRWRRKGAILGAFRGIANEPNALGIDAAIGALDAAQRQVELAPLVEARGASAIVVLGATWNGVDTDAAVAAAASERAQRLGGHVTQWVESLAVNRDAESTAVAGVARGLGDPALSKLAAQLGEALAGLVTARTALEGAAQPLDGAPRAVSMEDVQALQSLSLIWADSWSSLRGWARWQGLRQSALDAEITAGGLAEVVARIESGECLPGEARARFDMAFARAWALHEISGDDALKAFDGADHGRALKGFRDLDDERLVAAREEVRQLIGRRRPKPSDTVPTGGKASKTGLGLLQREITKKTRHLAIRRLLAELGDVAMQLKPCFLMSPMSVAQYLDADHPPFDIVVFDEASQIPVWDAIGAIARGKQAVIVGDPKQLPPTSFFSRGADSAMDDEDDVEDLESILEECIGAQVPTHRLRWHYRSRHESLIAFSNARYYDSKLLTFPSGDSDGRGVRVAYQPDAVYDKGASRTNKIEAQAVAKEVVRRLLDEGEKDRTIGVVTFSQAQQTLVLDLLEAAQRKHPEIERFFDDAGQEPVFVKNLENVQGDERDVIIFSIGYGPDANGRLSMNFGPLNNDGGERRLNVAITRAREEVLVYTSIRSDQIDLARTNARGVRDLRAFLSFAEANTIEADASESNTAASMDSADTSPDSPNGQTHDALVAVIGQRLTDRGWIVDYEVGRSDVRIDVGVRHPEKPGAFLAGIETDGLNYRRASTARDRDRLRSDVLEGLGWNLVQVWAVDWWRDADAELNRLDGALQALFETNAVTTPVATPDPEPSPPLLLSEDESDGAPTDESPLELGAPVDEPILLGPADPEPLELSAPSPVADPVADPVASRAPKLVPPVASPFVPAHVADLDDRSGEFYDDESTPLIRETIAQVVRAEAPITEASLALRVATTWGFAVISKKFRNRVTDLVADASMDSTEHPAGDGTRQRVYWASAHGAAAYNGYRPQDSAGDRPLPEVPQPELVNALVALLSDRAKWPLDDLQRETMNLFGGKRLTQPIRSCIGAALETLQSAGRVRMELVGAEVCVGLVAPSTDQPN